MNSYDIKIANDINRRILGYEGPEKDFLTRLIVARPEAARDILKEAETTLGPKDWIEAGLNCRLDEDVVPEALSVLFTTLEVLVMEELNDCRTK